ncbi:MAG: hypothetical protein CMH52_00665 [Myxococcales bacterium]|nr:hypothetical protein [Myxococcales bacterium]|tara:strand:- start:1635 stop:2240 length:606 start_codon:yes stop_codon:yes gene_type:complete
MHVYRLDIPRRTVGNGRQSPQGNDLSPPVSNHEETRPNPLRIQVDQPWALEGEAGVRRLHIGLSIIQTLNGFWPQDELYTFEGLNPQDASHQYANMLRAFRSQVPDSMQLLLAHHAHESGRSYVLARGQAAKNGQMNGVILSRLLKLGQKNWMITLMDTGTTTGEQIRPWLLSLLHTANRLQLGVDRIFVFDDAGCLIAHP